MPHVTGVTDWEISACDACATCWGKIVEKQSLRAAVEKLALAGEQAGFSIDQMIQMLNIGISVEALIMLILWQLDSVQEPLTAVVSLTNWLM